MERRASDIHIEPFDKTVFLRFRIDGKLNKIEDSDKLLAKLEDYYQKQRNNPNKKTGGLAARLQALQEQQQALLDEQRARNRAAREEKK